MKKTYSKIVILVIAFISLLSCSHNSAIDSFLDELEVITDELVTDCQNFDPDKLMYPDYYMKFKKFEINMKQLLIKYEGKDVWYDNMNEEQKRRFDALMNKQTSAIQNMMPQLNELDLNIL